MKKELIGSVVWAGVMIAVAFGASTARMLSYIDHDTVTRVSCGLMGLWIAWNGNRIPKRLAPSACARQAQRVAAWSMVLSGLCYTGVWVFAPISLAFSAGTAAVLTGIAVTLAYCLSLRSGPRTA